MELSGSIFSFNSKATIMPCDSSYQDPTSLEKNLSEVYNFLDELEDGIHRVHHGDGFDARVYNKGLPKSHLDEKTAELCKKLQGLDVSKYSLELQLWWRDHQRADKARVEMDIARAATEKERKELLSRLSPHERKLLGL